MELMIDGCRVTVDRDDMPVEEAAQYVARGREKYGQRLRGIDVHVDGDEVELTYDLDVVPFQRIRRITGYLVGSLERFNNGKRAEEADRVKHGI